MPDIQTFRDTFRGSRSNRYKITGQKSAGGLAGVANLIDPFILYAKSTSFPGSQIGMIPVSYQGRVIKFTGERQFTEWSIQVYDASLASDANNLRDMFEKWIEESDAANLHKQQYDNASNSAWLVEFDDVAADTSGGNDVKYNKTMSLFNCWPIDISPIDLSYEAADSFSEFTLTFAYDYHTENVA
jgi:hypothetical protein